MQKAQPNSSPTVAVYMITYNHELCIAQAIESVLMQKTDFPFKVIIGEDHSSDKTAAICLEYAHKYPDIVSVECNLENLGPSKNAVKTFRRCLTTHAEYIALLEGDDYWTDPFKLQKQVDFMEQHPLCSLLVGNSLVHPYMQETQFPLIKNKPTGRITFEDFERFVFPACTIFLKKSCFPKEFFERLKNAFFGDRSLFLMALNAGEVHYVDEIWGVYRGGPTSLTRGKSDEYFIKGWIPNLYLLKPYFIKSNRRWLRSHIAVQYERLAGIYFKQRKLHLVFLNLMQSLAVYPLRRYREYADAYYRSFRS